jgi:hypothetical protein
MFDPFEFQRMPGIGTALEPGDYVVVGRKDINDFPFAFIAPLEA